jgi:hypothetical protein
MTAGGCYVYPAPVARRTADVLHAARQVAHNAYGTNPRHSRSLRAGGCTDDCIPCGMSRLREALAAFDEVAGREADPLLRED